MDPSSINNSPQNLNAELHLNEVGSKEDKNVKFQESGPVKSAKLPKFKPLKGKFKLGEKSIKMLKTLGKILLCVVLVTAVVAAGVFGGPAAMLGVGLLAFGIYAIVAPDSDSKTESMREAVNDEGLEELSQKEGKDVGSKNQERIEPQDEGKVKEKSSIGKKLVEGGKKLGETVKSGIEKLTPKPKNNSESLDNIIISDPVFVKPTNTALGKDDDDSYVEESVHQEQGISGEHSNLVGVLMGLGGMGDNEDSVEELSDYSEHDELSESSEDEI